jgi:hypothetical protein
MLLPPVALYILPIPILAIILILGGELPRDMMRRGRTRRPGTAGLISLSLLMGASGYLLTPVYGPWGVIITALLGMAVWKRFYYVKSPRVDPLWLRG